jgi:AraC family transcriptional regulator of arabinose operon
MTVRRSITPHVVADPLVCGEFEQGPSYANWRPDGSGDWLLIYTLAGAGRIASNGRTLPLPAGSAILYRPGTAQDYATDPAADRWSLRWVHFIAKPHWHPWLAWPDVQPGTGGAHFSAEAAKRFAEASRRIILASRLGGPGATDLAMNALEEALIWAFRDHAGDRWLAFDTRIQKAMAELADDPARPFVLAELARHCGLSESRLSHLFKAQVKMTPRQFAEKLRLDLAMQLLVHTGLTVGEVAHKAGFPDPLYFSRRFVRAFGRAPVQVRTTGRLAKH